MTNDLYLNYLEKRISFQLPSDWRLLAFHEVSRSSSEEKNDGHVKERIQETLDHPISSPRIEEIAKRGMRAVILFDDNQRPTPAFFAFPEVLNRLNRSGIPDRDIAAICAVGTHPPMGLEDLRKKIGDEAFDRLSSRVYNHDSRSRNNVVIGKTIRGTLVEINPYVHEADFILGIGTCMPHPWAGFGGGTKIVMPGVVSEQTAAGHHLKWVQNRKTKKGLIEGNYFLDEQIEIARMVGLHFKIDFILDESNWPIEVFCGDPVEEHRRGVAEFSRRYRMDIPELSDVGITSAFPLEVGLQSLKGLGTAVETTKQGGHIIWVAPQVGAERLSPIWQEVASKKNANEYMRDLMEGKYPATCAHLGISLLITIHYIKRITKRFSRIIHVTQGISKEWVEAMGFTYASDLEEAIRIVRKERPEATVSVFPSGGASFPVVKR
jgi:nickel-dependent lactate racemase